MDEVEAQTGVVTDNSGQNWLLGSSHFGTGYGATSSAVSYNVIGYTSPSGLGVEVKAAVKGKEIGATLYIKYVKSKLGKIQTERAKKRLAKLQKLVAYSKEMGQRALYEQLTGEVAILVREASAVSFKIDQWIDLKHIDKFRHIVKDKVIKWEPLEKFPRVVPARVQKKVKQLQKAQVFDEYWILFIDYTKEPELKTTKEKIRQKDPIIFGKFNHQRERFYYIDDWVDEHCDLTLDKFIDKIKAEDPLFALNEVPDIDQARWDGIVHEVKARVNRLEVANADNFRKLMEDEEKLAKEREAAEAKPTTGEIKDAVRERVSIWRRIRNRFNRS